AGAYATLSALPAKRRPSGIVHRGVLLFDLSACITLLAYGAFAGDPATFGLMALYSYSAVVLWAAGRPFDAFLAAGACAAAYTILGLVGPAETRENSASFVSNLALYGFFALATSGFFTVARRIGALEIATEISKERGRYRRDLHDRLGQSLSGLHFELQAVRAVGLKDGIDAVAERLMSLANGYRDAESMLADLFRQGDEPLLATNVGAVVSGEAKRLAHQASVSIDVQVEGEPSRIAPWMRPHIVAIAGECMNNALKNGEADEVNIELLVLEDMVVLSVTDDGVGFDNPPGTLPEKVGHYGLREMAERARICGGSVVVASQIGFGTRVRLQVPLPEGGTDDIIERDASTLRRNVWTLITVLRTGLGAIALAQLVAAGTSSMGLLLTVVLAAAMFIDIALGAVRREQLFRSLGASPYTLVATVGVYVTAAAAVTVAGGLPYFMLYAPPPLLAAGILGGRRLALRLTLGWAGATVGLALIGRFFDTIDTADADTLMLYLANMVIIGISASAGATLLDRLETLQIRVRFQTLARLRKGLSNRMRDELQERLSTLEQTARILSLDVPAAPDDFSQQTEPLEAGSNELKLKLREIVHQLADPN
ncbi:MAG: hypothetical protein H7123_04980, partial [Thermoleophilia bacterium]|nr:hypothetical protein [Thermoleophilia bacterium]